MDSANEAAPKGASDWYTLLGGGAALSVAAATVVIGPAVPIVVVTLGGWTVIGVKGYRVYRWCARKVAARRPQGSQAIIVEPTPEQRTSMMFDQVARNASTEFERSREAYVDGILFEGQRTLRFETPSATIMAQLSKDETLELAARLAELGALELSGDEPRKRPEPKVI